MENNQVKKNQPDMSQLLTMLNGLNPGGLDMLDLRRRIIRQKTQDPAVAEERKTAAELKRQRRNQKRLQNSQPR